ncbi:hypothetical protein QBC33DRAFT_537427 [Phialemonium atrogriseum]|uniref:Uncharacterized protein n=1 Tax=Phialemonium atrogriseum TaxID=1093897 RepID=A0AAJ0FLX9_9PEZI|nr:uncharacterized protein QBC33DRAFT_537427 [Phialemonium atrogriseum]KAK1767803.1 hypothetical protein QBC33DRAFT_537427 [Phialemonium atrogriseum]
MSEEGHQSPPPERSSGRQMKETPGSGQGTDDSSKKNQANKQSLENLTSNPPGPLDAALEAKYPKKSSGS